jgi:hypothetical protein
MAPMTWEVSARWPREGRTPVFREKTHMSLPIMPIQVPSGQPRPTENAQDANAESFLSELSASDCALTIAADRGGPPAEVLDQISAAGRIGEQLRENGTHVRFSTGRDQRVAIELVDTKSNTVSKLSIAETLEIALGRPLG